MAGWSKEKREKFESLFYEFLNHYKINSKDLGQIVLGEHLFDAQIRFFDAVFDGLEDDIHEFYALKSRQLGISTAVRALSVFFLGMTDGLSGAIVFDTDFNKVKARAEIVTAIKNLPDTLGFPKIENDNRYELALSNQSTIVFMSAGVKQQKSSGTLGRSLGLSFAHCSELCSWDNDDGLEAFKNSLSENNPDRLYFYESTARGFNTWHTMWEEAKQNPSARTIFLGWWSKPSQMIPRNHPDFERYGVQAPSEVELRKIDDVFRLYSHRVTVEQLAWVRRKMDPSARAEGDAEKAYEGSTSRLQEQPWDENDAFQQTGSIFFVPEDLTKMVKSHVSKDFETFMFGTGIEFADIRVQKAPNARMIELKVWEEPEEGAVYVISADVAHGLNASNDRSSIQVLRCYADGVTQVAEYAWPLINTRQFAWVILALAGWYAMDANDIYLIIELNGPGVSVWDEIKSMQHTLAVGYQPKASEERGLKDIFRNVKNYISSRADSMGGARTWMWKTTANGVNSKVRLMERLRDFVANGMLHIRSMDTINEMQSVSREENTIETKGRKKDDRVLALALGVRCWEDRVRKTLAGQRRTREFEAARKRATITDQISLYSKYHFEQFFSKRAKVRTREDRILSRARWRYR